MDGEGYARFFFSRGGGCKPEKDGGSAYSRNTSPHRAEALLVFHLLLPNCWWGGVLEKTLHSQDIGRLPEDSAHYAFCTGVRLVEENQKLPCNALIHPYF